MEPLPCAVKLDMFFCSPSPSSDFDFDNPRWGAAAATPSRSLSAGLSLSSATWVLGLFICMCSSLDFVFASKKSRHLRGSSHPLFSKTPALGLLVFFDEGSLPHTHGGFALAPCPHLALFVQQQASAAAKPSAGGPSEPSLSMQVPFPQNSVCGRSATNAFPHPSHDT
jgi:hypothetical protein